MSRVFAALALVLLASASVHGQPVDPDPATPAAPAWQPAGDGSFERTVILTPNGDGSPAVFPLDLPQAGYVTAKPLLEEGATLIAPVLIDGSGIEAGSVTARIGQPVGASVQLALAADAPPVEVVMRSFPDFDPAEPDNDPLLAWPVVTGDTQDLVLLPHNDVDHVRFSLDAPGRVQVLFAGAPIAVATAFLNAQTGAMITEGPAADLDAGDYVIRFSSADGVSASREPLTYRILADPAGDAAAPEDAASAQTVAATLEIGRPHLMIPDASGQARAQLDAPQAGLYTFVTSNAGPEPLVEVRTGDGSSAPLPGHAIHLPEGPVDITIHRISDTGAPVFLTAYRREAPDPAEPNDLAQWATRLDFGDNQPIRLEAAYPVDWFAVTAPANGRIFLHAAQNHEICAPLRIALAPGGDGAAARLLTSGGPYRYVGFEPFAALAGETVRFLVACDSAQIDAEIDLSIAFLPDGADGTAASASIYVVGLELSEEASGRLEGLTRNAGGTYLNAGEATELDSRIADIVRAEGGGGRFPVLSNLIILGLFAGVGVWLLMRRRRDKA